MVLAVLADGKPRTSRNIGRTVGLSEAASYSVLRRCWESGLVLRTKNPLYEPEKISKGRRGATQHVRSFHLYALRPKGIDNIRIEGQEFVKFSEEYLDVRGGGAKSKADVILDFLRTKSYKAWFSKEIAEALKHEDVKICDIMANVRRFEERGFVYVRGYKLEERQTPFKEGYLITWINQEKSREEAIEDAIQKTDRALENRRSDSPFVDRVHRTRDVIIEHSKLRRLVSFGYIHEKLRCSEYEAEHALTRTLQLYPDLKEVKLFDAYRYFYHTSLSNEDLNAAIKMKENYIRMAKGRANRIGHNWEAVAEWFIDRFTVGAHFWTQNHRTESMDSRRITLHLIRGVKGRRIAAEVDRVWDVTPGVFAPCVSYVLSCKWGLIRKEDVDDFLEVLRWSKEFGVDTPDGRRTKQGVYGVFAGQAFNPKENVRLKNDITISLASYAARMNMQLLKAVDFNDKLRGRGCPRIVSVQKICSIAKDEKEIREILDAVWENSPEAEEILKKAAVNNESIYRFERMLNK
jgi:hypothetical protein